jgi:hypothetical protein
MPFDALVKDLTDKGLDAETAAKIAGTPAAAVLDDWRLNGLRQSDYDRKFNLSKAEIKAEKDRIAEQAAQLETERTRLNNEFLTAQQNRENTETALATVRAKARTASAVYGVDLEKELFEGAPAAQVHTQPQQQVQPTLDPNLTKRLDDVEALFAGVPAVNIEFQGIMIDHARLFPDKPLNRQAIAEIWKKSIELRITPTQVWDNTYGASAKEQELVADKYRQEGATAERERLQQEQSRRAANPLGNLAPQSAVMTASGKNVIGTNPGSKKHSVPETVQAASSDFWRRIQARQAGNA